MSDNLIIPPLTALSKQGNLGQIGDVIFKVLRKTSSGGARSVKQQGLIRNHMAAEWRGNKQAYAPLTNQYGVNPPHEDPW